MSILDNPPVLPDVIWLTVNSIVRAAISAIDSNKETWLRDWIDKLNIYVFLNGKFSQFAAGYVPFSPPPLLYDYKCRKCLNWVEPDGCNWVEGTISRSGWCSIWTPMTGYKAFSWPSELIKGDW
jgi:hypothetical protein